MAQKDFGTMKSNVGTELGDTSSSFATRLGVYGNNRYRDIINRLKSYNLYEVMRTVTITSTAAVSDYVMPFDFGTIVYAQDTTNNKPLDVITELQWLQTYGDNITQQSTPCVAIPFADSTVRVQPSSSTKLRFVSTSASDTTQNIVIRAISGSAEFYETVGLSGTTSGQSSNDYDYYLQVSKSDSTAGKITLSYVTGSETAAVISPEALETRYKRVRFHYVPAGSYEIDVRYERELLPLNNSDDYPVADIADGIELGMKADGWRTKKQFGYARDFELLYEAWIDRYIQQRMSSMIHQFQAVPYNRDTV